LIPHDRICAQQLGCDGKRRRLEAIVRARQPAMRMVRMRRGKADSVRTRVVSRAFLGADGEKAGKMAKRGEKGNKKQKSLVNINFLLKSGDLCKMYRCRKILP
jgi:hypothetical protein